MYHNLFPILLWLITGFICSFFLEPVGAAPATSAVTEKVIKDKKGTAPTTPVKSLKTSVDDLTTFPKEVSLPLAVHVTLSVDNITELNEQIGTFSAEIKTLWHWRDPRLKFEVKSVGSSTQKFTGVAAKSKLESIWHPQITITNLVNQPAQHDLGIVITTDGTVKLFQQIKAEFQTALNLNAFPFDTQRLSIKLLSAQYPVQQLILIQTQEDLDFIGIPQKNFLFKWYFNSLDFSFSKKRRWDGEILAQAEAQLVIQRDSRDHIPMLFMPLFLIIFTSLTVAFSLEEGTLRERITVVSGGLLTLITLAFTISLRYPALDVDTAVMQMFLFSFAFLWLMLFIVLIFRNPALEPYLGDQYILVEFRYFLGWSLPTILIIVLTQIMLLALSEA